MLAPNLVAFGSVSKEQRAMQGLATTVVALGSYIELPIDLIPRERPRGATFGRYL